MRAYVFIFVCALGPYGLGSMAHGAPAAPPSVTTGTELTISACDEFLRLYSDLRSWYVEACGIMGYDVRSTDPVLVTCVPGEKRPNAIVLSQEGGCRFTIDLALGCLRRFDGSTNVDGLGHQRLSSKQQAGALAAGIARRMGVGGTPGDAELRPSQADAGERWCIRFEQAPMSGVDVGSGGAVMVLCANSRKVMTFLNQNILPPRGASARRLPLATAKDIAVAVLRKELDVTHEEIEFLDGKCKLFVMSSKDAHMGKDADSQFMWMVVARVKGKVEIVGVDSVKKTGRLMR